MTIPESTTVDCRHSHDCGACALLGQDSMSQLKRKRWTLADALRKHPSLAKAKVLPTLASPQLEGYRSRAKMAVAITRAGGFKLGYFRRGTREVVEAIDCRVLVPELLDTTRRIRNFLDRAPGFPKELRHVDLRCGSDPGRQHLVLVFRSEQIPHFALDHLRAALPAVSGISVNLNPGKGPQVISGAIESVWGEREVFVSVAGLDLRISAGSFFQVNLSLLDPIHDLMYGFLGGGRLLADLYAGVGTHAFGLGRAYERVVAVEGMRGSAADAKDTITRSGVDTVEIIAAPVERSLRRLEELSPDHVVMNPSRIGAHRRVIGWLGASKVRRIAYLSCDPRSLAHDLDGLVERGFRLTSVQPIDMMPQTAQVEALAFLER